MYNLLVQLHPSMPNLIICKVIGMIYENDINFIKTLACNKFDFFIIVKESLFILMNATEKESVSFYKNNKYDIQNSYNIIISDFIDDEEEKKQYLLELIYFKFVSYYKFAIEINNNQKKLMFSDSTKISESIIIEMLNIMYKFSIEELEKIIFNISYFKQKCKESFNRLRDLVNKSQKDYPDINLMKINTIVNAYFL